MAARKQPPPKPVKRPPPPPPPEPEDDEDEDLAQGYTFQIFTSFCLVGLAPSEDTGQKAVAMLQRLDDRARTIFPRERGEAVEDHDQRILEELEDYVDLACRFLEAGSIANEAVDKAFATIEGFDAVLGDEDDEDDEDD